MCVLLLMSSLMELSASIREAAINSYHKESHFAQLEVLNTRRHFAIAAVITVRVAVLAIHKPPAGSCSHQQLPLTKDACKDVKVTRTGGNETP